MRLIGKQKLFSYENDEEVSTWICAWADDIKNAQWRNANDLKENFPKVLDVENNVFLFPIFSSELQIKVIICFTRSTVCISELITK